MCSGVLTFPPGLLSNWSSQPPEGTVSSYIQILGLDVAFKEFTHLKYSQLLIHIFALLQ